MTPRGRAFGILLIAVSSGLFYYKYREAARVATDEAALAARYGYRLPSDALLCVKQVTWPARVCRDRRISSDSLTFTLSSKADVLVIGDSLSATISIAGGWAHILSIHVTSPTPDQPLAQAEYPVGSTRNPVGERTVRFKLELDPNPQPHTIPLNVTVTYVRLEQVRAERTRGQGINANEILVELVGPDLVREVVFPIPVLGPDAREAAMREYQIAYRRPIVRNRWITAAALCLLLVLSARLLHETGVVVSSVLLCTLAFWLVLFQWLAFPAFVDFLGIGLIAAILAFFLLGFAVVLTLTPEELASMR